MRLDLAGRAAWLPYGLYQCGALRRRPRLGARGHGEVMVRPDA